MRKPTTASLRRKCFKLWGAIVLKRNPVCIVCKKEKSREPHHIFPRSRYRHLHFDLRNGAALCTKCHWRVKYDPMVPCLKIADHFDGVYGFLELDAVLGRRKNPYGKKELQNIAIALQEELEGSPKQTKSVKLSECPSCHCGVREIHKPGCPLGDV